MKYPRIAEDRSQLEQFAKETEAGSFGPKVELAGNSLVIPEQEGPTPVVEIDGVTYFHKQEFDLETIGSNQLAVNVLTGEEKTPLGAPMLRGSRGGASQPVVRLWLAMGYVFNVYSIDSTMLVDFTSRAFTVVDTPEEVTDNSKICLPTCSAYYGFLSEDGKTFISYYNLKSDGAPEYIDSIKQGNAVIPLHGKDVRLPDATAADVGKVLAVDEEGELVLQQAPAGGMKLYKHALVVNTSMTPVYVDVFSPDATQVTEWKSVLTLLQSRVYARTQVLGTVIQSEIVAYSYNGTSASSPNHIILAVIDGLGGSPYVNKVELISLTSDTVTEL